MSKYTARGSAELDDRIDADLRRIAEVAAPHSLSGVLLGGYGRGEGTPFINPDGSQSPFNDYDLIVVADKPDREKFQAMEKQLTQELGLSVDLYPYAKTSLPKCEFSLLNYEMKHGHKVVWGDEHILDAMPDYPHDAIPLAEGSRLLMNRGKLLLDIKQRLENPEPLTGEERIRFIKFIHKMLLAFGDCALLATGKYDIAYSVKKERILGMDPIPDRSFVIEGYLRAIALKEWGDYQPLDTFDITKEFDRVREVFLRFFPWYRAQYTARECTVPKAIALNLKWNKCLCTAHPRQHLYDAILELLDDHSSYSPTRFYALQRRFS